MVVTGGEEEEPKAAEKGEGHRCQGPVDGVGQSFNAHPAVYSCRAPMAQLGREMGSGEQEGAVFSPEDPEAPTTTPMSTPKPMPEGKRNRNYNWNRNNRGSVNMSTHQHVNTSTRQHVFTSTCQHGECSAGGGMAQELSWEVWALGDVVSDGRSSPGARSSRTMSAMFELV
jgi:hypothetical protein